MDVELQARAVVVQYGQSSKLIAGNVIKTLRSIGFGLTSYIARQKLSGQVLHRRTSTLSRALTSKVIQDGRDAVLVIGVDVEKAPYARIHEHGGTIRPKRSQFLAIPLDAARTAKGVARFSARQLFENPQSAGYLDAFIHNGVIFGVKQRVRGRGKNKESVQGLGSIEPLFALKRQVTMPARPYLRPAIEDRRAWILEQLGAAAVAGANGTATS
jgi:phage gpG-like protein